MVLSDVGDDSREAISMTPDWSALLALPAGDLLDAFGPGEPRRPAAGSAAALAGVLAAKLLSTVVALTRGKDRYGAAFPRLDLLDAEIRDRLEPALRAAVQEDAEVIDRVIELRRQRDDETDAERKRELDTAAAEGLERATEIPLEIARDCIRLAEIGLVAIENGYRAAKGDAYAAASLAQGAAAGALGLVRSNLRRLPSDDRAAAIRREAGELAGNLTRLQAELFSRGIDRGAPTGGEP
jgi:methenyltetrahydrofolate cyclohydrolase